MTIDDDLSSRITNKSNAKDSQIRFFAYRLATMNNKREISYETVVDTMEALNSSEKKLEYIVNFIIGLKYP